jgi:hypothetical protein
MYFQQQKLVLKLLCSFYESLVNCSWIGGAFAFQFGVGISGWIRESCHLFVDLLFFATSVRIVLPFVVANWGEKIWSSKMGLVWFCGCQFRLGVPAFRFLILSVVLRLLHGLEQWGNAISSDFRWSMLLLRWVSSGLTEVDGLRELRRIVQIQRYRGLCLIKGYLNLASDWKKKLNYDLGEPRTQCE